MNYTLTNEQKQLADSEAAWLVRNDPIVRARRALDNEAVAVDPAALAHAAESGLLALLTEDMGGSHADLGILSEAHGFAASSLPLADAAIACWLLHAAEAPQAAAASEGEAIFGVIASETGLVPLAETTPNVGVILIEAGADGDYITVAESPVLQQVQTLDLTRSWSRINDLSGSRFTIPSGTAQFVRDALALHRTLDAVGAAARLLEMTVVYAGQREQFGTSIGSFQAVKHHCANMAVGVEAGRAMARRAALALDPAGGAAVRTREVAAAAAYAKSAASSVAGLALQVHGGIGFTWEHDLHLLLRRIKVDEAMNGTVAHHRRVLIGR